MNIAVNTRLLQKNKLEGIGTFMDEVLRRIVKNHPEHTFHFIFDQRYAQDFIYAENVIPHVLFPPTKHVLLYSLWFDWQLPKLLKKLKIDVFLSLDAITSTQLSIPNHLVIHDINFEHRPQDLPKFPRNYYRKMTPKFCKTATGLATVSEFSKKDMMESYQVSSEKIDVVFNAAKSCFNPLNAEQQIEIRKKYASGKRYFLYVGSLHARKNLKNLILAFDKFRKEKQEEIKLLVVGKIMWETAGFKELLNNCKYKNDIVFTGRKSDEELSGILAAAVALTYVPYFEGFGIPIVEAFASGIPVITSNTTCLPEIAGEGALLANPDSVAEIADAMNKIATDEILRQNLIQKGAEKLQDYSWDKTAELYWKSVQKIF